MPKHAAELDAAIMTSWVTAARHTNCATNSEGQRSFDWASISFHYPKTWLYSGARYTPSHFSVFSQTWRRANPTPTPVPAETVRFQEQTLLATLRACLMLLLPGERRQYNEIAISMVTTTRSTSSTKWRCLS
jgi:hypothetical protein